jgi:two-component system, sensor histidine kinase and response regulator
MNETQNNFTDGRIKRIIEKYRDLVLRFREASAMWETTFDSLSDLMISIHDREQKIVKINKAFAEFVNKPPEEIIGRHCYEIVHGASSPILECPHCKCMETGKVETLEFQDEKTDRFFEVTATPRRSLDNSLAGTVHVIKDITSRKITENKMREQNTYLQALSDDLKKQTEKADAANSAKSRFLATMSHEIRTPLNGIVGMACLLNETVLNSEQRKYTDIINTSSDVLLSLINDILDVSKIEAGKLVLETIDFDLRDALENAVEVLAIRTLEKKLKIGYVIAPLVPSAIKGDPGRLRQIIINIVGNAVKFTNRGEVAVRVNLDSQNDDDVTLKFSISDTGIGIPQERMNEIFEPFVQGDSSMTRRFGGSGLGLAISKQLVAMMKGVIGVESTIGEGSTFWFTAVFEKQKNQPKHIDNTIYDFGGTKVLVVDDHEINRLHITTLLQENNCRYAPAGKAKEAIELLQKAALKKDPFRLALIEMDLPDMNGEELGKLIKASPDIASTQLISMTALGQKNNPDRLQRTSFFDALYKPVRRSYLIKSMALAMEKLKQAAQNKSISVISPEKFNPGSYEILVVEDNATNQAVIIAMLQKLGYKPDLANNGREAVEILKKKSYDIVLMDCQMPEMDGYTATGVIRNPLSGAMNPRVPIIAMTANALQEDRQICISAGMDDYVSKPVQANDLATLLKKWISASPLNVSEKEKNTGDPLKEVGCFREKDLLDRLMGDRELAGKIMTTFIREAPDQASALFKALESNNDKAQRLAHTIKGASSNIGAMRIQKVAADMERLIKDGKAKEAATLHPDLEKELVNFKRALMDKGYLK